MIHKMNRTATIFETALIDKKPVNALLGMAESLVDKSEPDSLHDIDVMLNGIFVEYMRKGAMDDFDSFIDDILAFLDSPAGDRLKSLEKGERYFYRWEHFHDLCSAALENYDPIFTARFVNSRKNGPKLMQTLFNKREGVRFNKLAQDELKISQQNLAKLLREFEEHSLIVRERGKNHTIVRLDFLGRAFMTEHYSSIEPPQESEVDEIDDETRQRIPGDLNESPKTFLMAA